jgi:hypothetical protein
MNSNFERLFSQSVGPLALGFVFLLGCDTSAPPVPPAQPEPAASPAPVEKKPIEKVKKKAEVGVGAKGRGYGQGVVATPAASFWAIKERIAFDIQIPQAMQLFKATENRPPKDHAEFMQRIIKENNIRLPELPEGDRYMYDPKTEQLMVELPAPE